MRITHYLQAAALCALALPALSQEPPQPNKLIEPTMSSVLASDAPAPAVLDPKTGSTVSFNKQGRPTTIVDAKGARHELSYDSADRVYAVARPDAGRLTVFHYLPESTTPTRPDALSLIDTATGKQISYVQVSRMRTKYLGPDDPEFPDFIIFVQTIDDPFSTDFQTNWGLAVQQPFTCKMDDCNTACDAGLGMATVACGAFTLASGPGGVLCAAVALGGWAQCRNRCSANCH